MKLPVKIFVLSIVIMSFILSACTSNKKTEIGIDGTYELTDRVMADSTVLRPPEIKALYVLFHGRMNLNLFVKKEGWNNVI